MSIPAGEGEGRRAEARDYITLFTQLCDCAGPQPSRERSRAEEHAADCPYRMEVEGSGDFSK